MSIRISQLTSLIGADVATNDVIPIVDVSASTTKKMTRAEFFKNAPLIYVNNVTPALQLNETEGSSGFDGNTILRSGDVFAIQTTNAGAFLSNDYRITSGASGALTHEWRTNNIEVMRIAASGNVGIGDTTPDVALDVVGDINYTGTITDVSDRRLKENVQDLANSLDKICLLTAKSYTLIADRGNETTEVELGFIAQEVQPVFPEIVKEVQKFATDENGELTDEEVNYLGVSYIQLVAPMVEAIKELKAKNDALEARITALGG
jgi:hypothetical protein